ncbi:hypothetical protein Vadar_020987 [Vaccinium darrowii]|uniref:Uncharacterized protein n=1 Tax=Vaccinium darrowii TaxID=229202 RepID=A0ACB7XBB4_9ERIC|nr:hypothetical protein Vadar_020987 [Vaccinium darrowii]
MILDNSDSDEELEMLAIIGLEEERLNQESQPRRRGSIQGHAVIDRDRVEGHNILFRQYFADPPTFPPKYFRRRFRMNRSLFLRIVSTIEAYDPYFVQKPNAVGMIAMVSYGAYAGLLLQLLPSAADIPGILRENTATP